jgi:hypothetical protein
MKIAIMTRLLAEWNVDVYASPTQPPQRGGVVKNVIFLFRIKHLAILLPLWGLGGLFYFHFVSQKHPNPYNFSQFPLFPN